MKICFITPGSVFLLDERVFINLGILKVAAACEARGHEVEHLDLDGVSNFEDAIRLHVSTSSAAWFAITATTPQMPAVARIVAVIKETRPGAKTIIGGPHPTLIAAAVKLENKRGTVGGRASRGMDQLLSLCDVVVAGDGEDAIETAMRQDKGLIDADDPKGTLFLTRKRLEELPPPSRHLVDLDSYHYTIDGVPATSLVAQLGCPFNCSFCGGRASPMLRRARMRSTESVLAEIENLHNTYGYLGYMLYDDELNVNPKMVELMKGIVDLQKKLGVPGQFRLRGFVKSELVTKEQVEVMYEAGFRWLLCGFEAGHPRILENIQKKATVEENTRCVELAKAAGLKVKALMSIGHAGESTETVKAVKDWLLAVKPEDFDCTIITPYPGSPYYDEAVRPPGGDNSFGSFDMPIWTYTSPGSGDRLHAFELDYMKTADYYKGDPDGGYRSYVFTDHLSPEDLVKERDALEREVRSALNIPFNPGQAAIRYEHSMGQTAQLPPTILRTA
jgi:radical SAM superfamily enzyme YgiQ (UPF0313 family)